MITVDELITKLKEIKKQNKGNYVVSTKNEVGDINYSVYEVEISDDTGEVILS